LKGAVWAAFVVVLAELIELLFELGDRSCRWPRCEPALQRLVETRAGQLTSQAHGTATDASRPGFLAGSDVLDDDCIGREE